jgi:hypothetical protein
MINQEEAAICKRRGRDAGMGLKIGWSECKWCGTWLRELCTIEEDTPPADQQSALGPWEGSRRTPVRRGGKRESPPPRGHYVPASNGDAGGGALDRSDHGCDRGIRCVVRRNAFWQREVLRYHAFWLAGVALSTTSRCRRLFRHAGAGSASDRFRQGYSARQRRAA